MQHFGDPDVTRCSGLFIISTPEEATLGNLSGTCLCARFVATTMGTVDVVATVMDGEFAMGISAQGHSGICAVYQCQQVILE